MLNFKKILKLGLTSIAVVILTPALFSAGKEFSSSLKAQFFGPPPWENRGGGPSGFGGGLSGGFGGRGESPVSSMKLMEESKNMVKEFVEKNEIALRILKNLGINVDAAEKELARIKSLAEKRIKALEEGDSNTVRAYTTEMFGKQEFLILMKPLTTETVLKDKTGQLVETVEVDMKLLESSISLEKKEGKSTRKMEEMINKLKKTAEEVKKAKEEVKKEEIKNEPRKKPEEKMETPKPVRNIESQPSTPSAASSAGAGSVAPSPLAGGPSGAGSAAPRTGSPAAPSVPAASTPSAASGTEAKLEGRKAKQRGEEQLAGRQRKEKTEEGSQEGKARTSEKVIEKEVSNKRTKEKQVVIETKKLERLEGAVETVQAEEKVSKKIVNKIENLQEKIERLTLTKSTKKAVEKELNEFIEILSDPESSEEEIEDALRKVEKAIKKAEVKKTKKSKKTQKRK